MYSLDSLSLKYFYEENKDFILNSIVQKIQLPSRYEVIFNIRNLNESKNKKLYININPKYPHICFVNEDTIKKRCIKIPKTPPMFCMQLRKYLNGSKIKDFKIVKYERILEFYFDYFDEIGSLTKLCLALEFMGKHSNIILYNAQNKVIIGSIHNISSDKSSIREIYGGISYIYPPIKQKQDILNVSYSTFLDVLKQNDIKSVSQKFYYFSIPLTEKVFSETESNEQIFKFMQELASLKKKDYLCSFWGSKDNISESIDEYFSNVMFDEILSGKKQLLKKYLKNDMRKFEKTISRMIDDTKYKKYKNCADILSANLYNGPSYIKNNFDIELDENLTLSENAQKYYSLYKKSKLAYEHNLERFHSAKNNLEYFEGIIFDIDNSQNYDRLDEIKDEIIDLGLIKEQKQNPEIKILKINFEGWDIYIGKNNKQNDYIISKIARSEDLWFHGLNFPSAHVVLKIPNDKNDPPKSVIEYCAKLAKENSKAKNSGKASVIMTKRKNLKKPPNTHLGYVTYKNEVEIVI